MQHTSMQQYQNISYLFIEKGMGRGFKCIKNLLFIQREGEKCEVNMAKLCLYVKSEWWTLSLTFLYILLFVKGIIQLYIVRSISNLTLLSKRKIFQCTCNTQCKMYPFSMCIWCGIKHSKLWYSHQIIV